MPLFKGKGCKSTPGKAIAYITDENKAEIVSSSFVRPQICTAKAKNLMSANIITSSCPVIVLMR